MYTSVAETRGRLADLLKRPDEGPVTITRRGRPVGVIIKPETYERLRRVEAYLQMLKLSESLKERGLTASELFEASRAELEERP
jgi:prevent-host-death family protein